MTLIKQAGLIAGLAFLFAVSTSRAADIEIPYTEFTLDNGLRVIVHEDHKAPIVAVNIWYHVGSKDEKPGKTGFAHLFEHLMFNGSENYDDEFFGPFKRSWCNRAERHDVAGSHQLLPERSNDGRRHGLVDGIGPDGALARRGYAGTSGRTARRGAERETAGR